MTVVRPSTPHGDRNRALVTGATGYIGSHLVPSLRRAGYSIVALVRDESRAARLGEGVELFVGDLTRPETLVGLERGVDVVVHCASDLGKWGTPDSRVHAVNVQGAIDLLRRFRESGLRRFVHLSAGGVTGPTQPRVVDETCDCKPATIYERTKLLAERRLLELALAWDVPLLVVRPTFTYGPGDPHKLPLFRAVQRGRYAFIGGGQSVNHPVFIDDVVRGILLALERGRPGEVYILGGPEPVTKRQLVHAIADGLGVKRPRASVPRWLAMIAAWNLEWLGRLLRFPPILTRSRVLMMTGNFGYSIAKARAELGYAPEIGLAEGIAAAVRSYEGEGRL